MSFILGKRMGAIFMGTMVKIDADIRNNYFIVGTTDNYDGKQPARQLPYLVITSISAPIRSATSTQQ